MTKIGLISDTHGYFDPKIYEWFKDVDEIWHAGDIGSEEVLNKLEEFKPTKAVFGNIDNWQIRSRTPEFLEFKCEELKVLITHIGGYPGRYAPSITRILTEKKPDIFICGHSHILKVINDSKLNLLHLNPGAIGKSGFHQVRTALRFQIEGNNIKEMEIIELKR